MNIEAKLFKYLVEKGIHPAWANGALRVIRFSTNSWFATHVTVQHLKKDGDYIKKLVLHLKVRTDFGKEQYKSAVYTFDRKRKGKEHMCEYTPATHATFIAP